MTAELPGAFEALCVGETMSLIAPEQPVALENAARFTLSAGGAESNVAMHLAGLGHRVGWASKVGDDPLGRRLVADISAAGVATDLVATESAAPTGVYFKNPGPDGTRVHYYRSGSAASTMDEGFLGDGVLDAVEVLHVSGITPALSAACDRMVQHLLARPRRHLLSFDVNHRPAMWPAEQAAPRLRELADLADIVFVGLDEAAALWGARTAEEVRAMLPRPGTVVVKDAANAAWELGAEPVSVPAPHVDVVEPVGAGDAFAAGYLAGVLRGFDPQRRLRFGHLLAAHSLLSTTDQTAPPEEPALAGWLDRSDQSWRALRFGEG
ncbi:sugar kinase [Salinifilum aidingensis]